MTDLPEDYLFSFDRIFDDLYENDFDLTWQKYLDPRPKVCTIIDPEVQYTKDDGSVIYNYNEQSFRSDDFISGHLGKHVLFAGCSETEGVGGNIEDTWSNILYRKISSEEQCSGFFNLARSGWGWRRIILNSIIYFKKYGYPHLFFILLPNNQRKFFYDLENKRWKHDQCFPGFYNKDFINSKNFDPDSNNKIEFSDQKKYLEDFVDFLIAWKLFMEFCKNKKIQVFFACWDHADKNNFNSARLFQNYIDLDQLKMKQFSKDFYKINEVKPDDLKKRDGHSGRLIHHFWANEFYQKYKESQL